MENNNFKSYSLIYKYNKNSKVKLWFFICVLSVCHLPVFAVDTKHPGQRNCYYFIPGPAATTSQYHYRWPGNEMAY